MFNRLRDLKIANICALS